MIDDLQAENRDLKRGDFSVDGLEETLHSAQYALDKATGDRLKLENDFKIQVDNDAIVVNRLKNEGIDLKHTLADRNEEIARLRSTLSNLKYTIDLKRGDLNHLKDEFRINKEDNEHLGGTAEKLDRDLKIEIDVNSKLKHELDDIHGKLRVNDDDYHDNSKTIKALEGDNKLSRVHQDNLNRDIDEIEHRLRDLHAKINVLEGKERGIRVDLDHIENSIGDLSGKYDSEINLFENIRDDLAQERDRHGHMQEDHHRLTKAIEEGRMDLDGLRRELEDLNEKIKYVTNNNADFEYQLSELKRHIEVLTKQNTSLNVELQSILDLDRKVREELDRRAAIAEKQRMNEENLQKSLNELHHIRNHSPPRRS